MGYRELLQALEEEVGRQIRERRAEALQEQSRLLETTRVELLARREKVIEEERRRLAEESARALSRARLEQDHALLGEMRRRMAELQREAETRLATLNGPGLLIRLVDELLPELGEGAVVLRVRKGDEEPLAGHLRKSHAGLLLRSTIEGAPDIDGGVEVCLEGRQRLDNTLRSRLLSAWQQLEPEIAAVLFGPGTVEAPRPPEPSLAASGSLPRNDHGAR